MSILRAGRKKKPAAKVILFLQKAIRLLAQYWLPPAILVAASILMLAFLAPALMASGYPEAGQRVYRWLAPHDHQLPQRSYFLFGENGEIGSYSRAQVIEWGADPANLRAFVGNPQIGFKMGLNHRMTAIFVAILVAGAIWTVSGGRPRLGPIWFILLLLPLLIDGFSHINSENSGLGYRQTNAWAVALTGGVFPPEFYRGSTIGSLNWLLRTVTGILFGVGFTWFLFTYLSRRFAAIRRQLDAKKTAKDKGEKFKAKVD